MATISDTVTKVFCAPTEPEVWAQVSKYQNEHHVALVDYLLDCASVGRSRIIEKSSGIAAAYNMTATFRKVSKKEK